jgi:hypothetical protein
MVIHAGHDSWSWSRHQYQSDFYFYFFCFLLTIFIYTQYYQETTRGKEKGLLAISKSSFFWFFIFILLTIYIGRRQRGQGEEKGPDFGATVSRMLFRKCTCLPFAQLMNTPFISYHSLTLLATNRSFVFDDLRLVSL